MRAALIFNPNSGSRRAHRAAILDAAAEMLRASGHTATLIPTRSAGSAGEQAIDAITAGHDTIFACGGDGTIHDVLQGMMHSAATRRATLGLLPLGTGNVLANDLGLRRAPIPSLKQQLSWTPRQIALGKVEYNKNGETRSRHFITTVGIGADAEMLYRVTTKMKGRLGLLAYLYEGSKLGLSYGFPPFAAEYLDDAGRRHRTQISQVMAVRISDFGNFLRRFAPGASLLRDDMQLVLFKTRRVVDYFSYMTSALTNRHWRVSGVELVHSKELECLPLTSEKDNFLQKQIAVEADGEVLGRLPARITVVPKALNLLMRPS
jgi:YegS/Rv2252/BmrU family lipid kinase